MPKPQDRRALGLEVRERTVGQARVQRAFREATSLAMPLQELVTDFAWGEVWTRPDLDLRSRSILTVGMLIALDKQKELKVHMAGGLNNGVTVEELREIVIHAAVYAGFPAALSAMQVLQDLVDAEIAAQ